MPLLVNLMILGLHCLLAASQQGGAVTLHSRFGPKKGGKEEGKGGEKEGINRVYAFFRKHAFNDTVDM